LEIKNGIKMSNSWNTLKFAGKQTSLLTWTTDMDCYSFSLPAGPNGACPLSVTGEGTICGSCYAMINRYNMPNVLNAQYLRFAWVKDCIARWADNGKQELIDTLTKTIEQGSVKSGSSYFRFFDSGDFFHPLFIEACYEICKALPTVMFWFPTRIWYKGTSDNWVKPLRKLSALPNVVVRPSAIAFNDTPPRVKGLSAGTTVITDENAPHGSICPKTQNGGNCTSNGCRKCWDSYGQVSYLVHGIRGSDKPVNAMSDNIQNKRIAVRNEFTSLTLERKAVV
jgi:hypothetical protein